jgi:thiamine-phosphate pyrophosphorylase|tara:strand:+ start:756 stop:1283 length:528 start_codon:yes stop_codon:yes gene_type:complete
MHNKLPKKYYFIDKFNKNNIDKQKINTAIIYRNYKKKLDFNEILYLKNYCKKRKLKFLLSNNIKLAHKLNLDGAYIPSFNKDIRHLSYSFKKNFIVIGSAHNIREIRIKELQNVNAIFLSSIFKHNKNYLGSNKFKIISKMTTKKVIALGGINKKNINLINILNCYGFSGISYFQ